MTYTIHLPVILTPPLSWAWKASHPPRRWRASLTAILGGYARTVAVDFTGILANGNYALRNAENPTESWDFVAAGEAVNVPTNFTAAARIGDVTPPTTWPVFGACVIEAR